MVRFAGGLGYLISQIPLIPFCRELKRTFFWGRKGKIIFEKSNSFSKVKKYPKYTMGAGSSQSSWVPGYGFLVPGFWFLVSRSRLQVSGSVFYVPVRFIGY